MGSSNTFALNSINLKADIINDPSQKDVFMQWLGIGFLDLDKAAITLSSLTQPVEIPSIKLDFDHENFTIKESKVKIDKSDFSLSGKLSNVLSYFRKDSLLRADFSFVSNNTDLLQLMALTNGLGETPAKDSTSNHEPVVKNTQPANAPVHIWFQKELILFCEQMLVKLRLVPIPFRI